MTKPIVWRLHLRSTPDTVFAMLTTGDGRARFWADLADEEDGVIRFRFSNGQVLDGRVLEQTPPSRFRLSYFGGSTVTFELEPAGNGGTDLTLSEVGMPPEEYEQNLAGWVSVLLTLKAAVDHGVDLRNHDPNRSWEDGYVDV